MESVSKRIRVREQEMSEIFIVSESWGRPMCGSMIVCLVLSAVLTRVETAKLGFGCPTASQIGV